MSVRLVTVTNVSKQTVPILLDAIPLAKASDDATVPAALATQLQIAPSAEVTIESRRVDLGQLEQLRRLRLLTFTVS